MTAAQLTLTRLTRNQVDHVTLHVGFVAFTGATVQDQIVSTEWGAPQARPANTRTAALNLARAGAVGRAGRACERERERRGAGGAERIRCQCVHERCGRFLRERHRGLHRRRHFCVRRTVRRRRYPRRCLPPVQQQQPQSSGHR